MENLRNNPPMQFGKYDVLVTRDYDNDLIKDVKTGETKPTGIPKSNVLYLENGKSVGETIYKDTFGANVNDILHQSFFLKKGFMGEFARDKIQSVIDFLNSKNSSKWTKESSLEFIEKVVSEPILQRQLRSLYEKRYDLRDNKIEKLESEIERLKQKLKDLKK